ncbi:MAG: hypothetical protein WC736_14990 [Gallionella sp.]|jgi:hypothetical protein
MTTYTTALEIEELEPQPVQPDLVVNEALNVLDSIIGGQLTHEMTSDADYSIAITGLHPQEWQYSSYLFTDSPSTLTTGRSIIWPAKSRRDGFAFKNSTAQTLTVKRTGQTGYAVTAGSTAMLRDNGTDIEVVFTGPTGATGAGYTATSVTSLAIASSGSKVFTTQTGLAYTAGARIRATSIAAGDYMEGVVTAYSGSTLTVTMDRSSGSGTHIDWNINVIGDVGPPGSISSLPVSLNASSVANPQFDMYSETTYRPEHVLSAYGTGIGSGGLFTARYARGTKASPTACQAGDVVGAFGAKWCANAGSLLTTSPVDMQFEVTENQTSTANGSWIKFSSVAKTTTTKKERGGITDNGTFWSHDGATYDAKLDRQTLPTSDARFVASAEYGTQSSAAFVAVGYGAGTGCLPVFRGIATGGTAALPSATASGFFLCGLVGHGHDGTNITISKAQLLMTATENWSGSAQGCEASIATTKNTTTTTTAHFKIPNDGGMAIVDGITAPAAQSGWAKIYVDTADGDLKVIFGDSTIKTIVVDT